MRTILSGAALAAAVVITPLAVASPAQAETSTAPVPSAGFLATQLAAGGDRLVADHDGQRYDDLGLTLDAVMSLTAAKSADDQARASMQYVIDHSKSYYGSGEELYANALGKLLTAVTVRDLDPTSVDGVNLVTTLQGLELDTGQFADRSQWGDYSNTLGQSFALIGLKRAGVNPSPASVEFLLSQQCTDGGFSLDYVDGCVSDPDATSLAIQALHAVGGHDDAMARGADYLESKQTAEGGVEGGTTTEGPNANSTGLAAVAYRLTGHVQVGGHHQAQVYLQDLVLGCEYTNLAGGIAYNHQARSAIEREGTDAPVNDQIIRATAQALMGLTEYSYVDATPAGATAETIVDVCEEPEESPTPSPSEPGGSDNGSTSTPAIPAEVRTDSHREGTPVALLGGAAGLTAALGAAGAVLARRREAGTHR